MQRVLAVVVFLVLTPALAWTEAPSTISPDRDLLIRLDQRQQQLDEGVKSLKDDFLRAMDTCNGPKTVGRGPDNHGLRKTTLTDNSWAIGPTLLV